MEEPERVAHEVIEKMIKKLEYIKESNSMKSKNELLSELSKLSLKSEPEYLTCELLELGTVLHYTEGTLVILASPKAPLLELDTKVCTDDFLVIGKIDDIIGSVEHPHYALSAFNYLPQGTEVFYPANSHLLSSLSRKRGTDASNHNDEETSEESSEDLPESKNKRKRKKNFAIFSEPAPFE